MGIDAKYNSTMVRLEERELEYPFWIDDDKGKLNGRLYSAKIALQNKDIDVVELDFSELRTVISREAMDKIVKLVFDECGIENIKRITVGVKDREVYLDSLRSYISDYINKFDVMQYQNTTYSY